MSARELRRFAMYPAFKFTWTTISSVLTGGLYAVSLSIVGIPLETGGALAVIIAVLGLFKMNQRDGKFLTWPPGQFQIPTFPTVLFILGLCSYVVTYALLQNGF
jgi:hypothetical protein